MPLSILNLNNNGSFSMIAPLVLGQLALGGKVGYILTPSDSGYDPNRQHGLIVSLVDLAFLSATWWNGSYITTGATGILIGTGFANTNTIIAAQGAGTYAASIARNYTGGGYTDWYLPSKNELHALYNNKSAAGLTFNGGGHWSSTEGSNAGANIEEMTIGASNPTYDKSSANNVRAIRSF